MMRLSAEGARFIGGFEGLRLTPYDDAAGHATIGYGHLIHLGPVTAADRRRYRGYSTYDATVQLQSDAEGAAACVRANVRPPIRLQARFDALVSFVFNLGCGFFEQHLVEELNRPGRGEAADKMLRYDHAGGQRLAGLTRRREAERRLFLTGRYP